MRCEPHLRVTNLENLVRSIAGSPLAPFASVNATAVFGLNRGAIVGCPSGQAKAGEMGQLAESLRNLQTLERFVPFGLCQEPQAMTATAAKADHESLSTRWSLLTRLKNWDDQESWKEFFDTYWRLIYNVAIKAGLSDAEAQDVVQETVLTVAEKLRSRTHP